MPNSFGRILRHLLSVSDTLIPEWVLNRFGAKREFGHFQGSRLKRRLGEQRKRGHASAVRSPARQTGTGVSPFFRSPRRRLTTIAIQHIYATIKNVLSPLSQDEHAAMARYLAGIKKQLQEVSDLFKSRYGKGSEISETAVRALASAAVLERDFSRLYEPSAKLVGVGKELLSRAN